MKHRRRTHTPLPTPPPALTPLRPAGHGRDRLLLLGSVLAPVVIGGIVELFLPHEPKTVLAVGGAMSLTALFGAWRWRRLRDLLGSFKFAAAILGAVALVVTLGTLVPQEKPAEFYAANYPHAGAVLQALGVTHMFHGAWFSAMLGTVAGGLVVSALRRWPPTRRNFGFFMCHLGLLVIMGGSALSVLFAQRGRLDLRIGSPPLTSITDTRTGADVDLGFAVRLDGFTVDTYAAEHRFTVYSVPPSGEPKPLASIDEDVGVVHRLPDGASYRVRGRSGAGAGATHTITEAGGAPRAVAIGDDLTLADGRTLHVVAFYPHFTFDLETRTATSVDDEPVNPTLEVTVAAPGDSAPRRRFLFAGPGAKEHGGGGELAYAFNGAAGGPAIVVEVTDATGTHSAQIPAARGGAIYFGVDKALVYERRGEEARSYRSAITVITGEREQPLSVAVNSPAEADGWSLYQVSFDPRDRSRSGLDAVHDPGIPWVFAGFVLVSLGVPFMVNLEPWLRRRSRKGTRS